METFIRIALSLALLPSAGASIQYSLIVASASRGQPVADEPARGSPLTPAACFDGTPHKKTLVRVEKEVQLQVLDWGGAEHTRTMVLLTGLGDNAHVYDQFAFQFTDDFHVIGITRRGYPPSSVPGTGTSLATDYDLGTRARDDIAVLDSLGIHKAVFVGHSIAGSELSTIAVKYGDRAEKLVYIDAFDLSKRFELPDVPPAPDPEEDHKSLQSFLAGSERLEDILRPAQAVCFSVQFDENGVITASTTPGWIPAAILQGAQEPASPPTDWAKVKAPRLGIFSEPSVQGRLAFYWYLSAKDREKFDDNWPGIVKWYAERTDEFAAEQPGRPKPVVYRLPDAPHYFYLNDQAFVVRVMREFLLGRVSHDRD
jgi:non-heme chloroperoxidase